MAVSLLGIIQLKAYFLTENFTMKKILILMILVLVSGCQKHVFEAGHVKKERQELYDYNNDEKYCRENPDRCVGNVPW